LGKPLDNPGSAGAMPPELDHVVMKDLIVLSL